MDFGFKRAAFKAAVGAFFKPTLATMQSHPELVRTLEDICRRNGIDPVPGLLVSETYPGVAALTRERQILVGMPYLEFLIPPRAIPAVLAHEMMHILCGHSKSTPEFELLADRGAAALLGDRAPVVAMVSAMNATPRMPHEEIQRTALYGSSEGRLNNAEQADPADRTLLDQKIAEYIQKTAKKGRG